MTERTYQLTERLDATRLLTLPPILLSLLDRLSLGEPQPSVLAGILDKDPSLVVKILDVFANNLEAAPRENFAGISTICVELGTNVLQATIWGAAIQSVFKQGYGPKSGLKRFWQHAVHTAFLSRLIAVQVGYSNPEEAYLGGLLHDIGRLAHLDRPKEAVDEGKFKEETEPSAAESLSSHAESGADLIDSWRHFGFVAAAVRYHHEPFERIVDADPLAKIVWLANCLSHEELDQEPLLPHALTLFNLTQDTCQQIVAKATGALEKTAAFFEIEFFEAIVPPIAEKSDSSDRRKNRPVRAPREDEGVTAKDIEKRIELTRAVRDMALLDGFREKIPARGSQAQILKVAEYGMSILFGVQEIFCFVPNSAAGTLRGLPSAIHPSLRRFEFPVNEDQHLVVRCLLQKTPLLYQGTGPVSLRDEQLLRILGKPNLLCIPLRNNEQVVAIIAAGLDPAQASQMRKRLRLASAFGALIGKAFATDHGQILAVSDKPSQELEALRMRARQIGHEASNPLSIIRNYLKLLSLKFSEKHAAQNDLKIVAEEIDRIGAILRGLSNLEAIAPANTEDERVEVNQLIMDLARLASEPASSGEIQVRIQPGEDVPTLQTSKSKVKQIVINLFNNAIESMPQGGTVTLATSQKIDQDGQAWVEILVQDTGPGIPPEILGHLFKPVESTKGQGHAGLGLSIVRELVTEIQANIACSSGQGGTSFQVLLPRK